jgi:hypothetical protein
MPLAKSLWFALGCLLACPSTAGALFLGVRDDGQGEASPPPGPPGRPPGPPPSHGPPPETGDGGRPNSYWTFWPPPSTTPLTVTTSATSSPPTSSTTGPASGAETTSPVAVSPSTTTESTSSTPPPGTSRSTETAIDSQLPSSSSAGSGTITTMPTDAPTSPTASATSTVRQTNTSSNGTSGVGSNRTLTITLSTVLSVVGALLVVGALMICLKYRKRRIPFFARGISPIDDDEIATWKTSRDEKAALASAGAAAGTRAPGSGTYTTRNPGHGNHTSTGSIRKPPSVIVYQGRQSQQLPRPSGEGSPRSPNYNSPGSNGRMSFDKDVPQTPIQAVAPNARAGLTDEAVPGENAFLPSPKRHPSRLSKFPPNMSSPRGNHSHMRTRSSRSSMRSFGGEYGYYTGSDMELSPRTSNDYYNNMHQGHSRVYSSSSIPPTVSFGEDGVVGGLSQRPLFRDNDMIGRAIG